MDGWDSDTAAEEVCNRDWHLSPCTPPPRPTKSIVAADAGYRTPNTRLHKGPRNHGESSSPRKLKLSHKRQELLVAQSRSREALIQQDKDASGYVKKQDLLGWVCLRS